MKDQKWISWGCNRNRIAHDVEELIGVQKKLQPASRLPRNHTTLDWSSNNPSQMRLKTQTRLQGWAQKIDKSKPQLNQTRARQSTLTLPSERGQVLVITIPNSNLLKQNSGWRKITKRVFLRAQRWLLSTCSWTREPYIQIQSQRSNGPQPSQLPNQDWASTPLWLLGSEWSKD